MRNCLGFSCFVVVALSSNLSHAQERPPIPPDVIDSWSYLIGNWTVEGEAGQAAIQGTASFEWAAGKSCYFGKQVWQVGGSGRSIDLALIGGWDAAAKETVERGFSSAGVTATVHYRATEEGSNVIVGTIEGVNGPDERWSGTIKIERHGPDEFLLTTTVDGEVVHELKYVRDKEVR
jgi:hypothetical protein